MQKQCVQGWVDKREVSKKRGYLFVLTFPVSMMKQSVSHLMSGVLRVAGVLLTNNQVAEFAAQRVILEPFTETAGAHLPLLPAVFL